MRDPTRAERGQWPGLVGPRLFLYAFEAAELGVVDELPDDPPDEPPMSGQFAELPSP